MAPTWGYIHILRVIFLFSLETLGIYKMCVFCPRASFLGCANRPNIYIKCVNEMQGIITKFWWPHKFTALVYQNMILNPFASQFKSPWVSFCKVRISLYCMIHRLGRAYELKVSKQKKRTIYIGMLRDKAGVLQWRWSAFMIMAFMAEMMNLIEMSSTKLDLESCRKLFSKDYVGKSFPWKKKT